MPTVINPAVGETFPASLTGPADGDLANAASVNGAFQSVMNGIDLARIGLFGKKLRPRYYTSNRGNGGATHPQVTVEALGRILVTEGGIWKILQHTVASVIDLHTLLGAQTAAATRYYLYASSVAGVLTWQISTTGPSADLAYFSGGNGTDWAYIGTVYSSTADIILFESEYGGNHIMKIPASDLGPFVLGTAIAPVSNVTNSFTLPVGTLVPSYVKTFKLLINVIPDGAGTGLIEVSGNTPASQGLGYAVTANSPPLTEYPVDITPDDGQTVYYSSSTAHAGLSINLQGWQDPR